MHVAHEGIEQVIGVKDVNAHRAQRFVGVARHGRGIGRFFDKPNNLARLVDCHHAEPLGIVSRHLDAGDGAFGAACDVLGKHDRVVHLVDMVAGEDDHILGEGPVTLQNVDVLIDGIGRSPIPGILIDALLSRQ